MVFEIERKLAEDGARPLIFYDRRATCWRPQVKGLTIMVNSIFNRGRMEDCLVGEVDRRVAASGVREAGAGLPTAVSAVFRAMVRIASRG